MNSTSPHLQMPTQLGPQPSKTTAASVSRGATQAEFAEALSLLQQLAGDLPSGGITPSAKEGAKSKHKQHEDGKDLPLSDGLLPLMQPLLQVVAVTKPAADGTASTAGKLGADASPATLAQLRELMQWLGASRTHGADAGALKTWLDALAQAKAHASTAPASGSPAPTVVNAALTAPAPPAQNAQTPTPPALALADPGLTQNLAERVAWLAGQGGVQAAQLQLHPRELGPMLVHIKVDGHHTEVLFQTQQAVVRDALESALPRLREMLGQGGQQVSVNIQQQGGGWQGQSGQGQQQTPQWVPSSAWSGLTQVGGDSSDLPSPLARWYGMQNGMIDTYV